MKKISLIVTILFAVFLSMAFVLLPQNDNPILEYLTKQVNEFSKQKQFESLYLEFDKTLYKPGEKLWFSAFLRNSDDFKIAESEILYVELINPKGAIIEKRNLLFENGVFQGDFQLSNDAVGGIYKIKAYSKWLKNIQNEVFEKEITVQAVVLPTLLMDLEFERKAYGIGDKPTAKLELKDLKSQALSNFDFQYQVLIDGNIAITNNGKTDKKGEANIQFQLPENLKTADASLNVLINYQGQTESIAREIPIVLNDLDVQFLPEGGNLVANDWNNVAFKAVKANGKAADIEGMIYNEKEEIVASFSSYHNGMGKVSFIPKKQEKLFAKIILPKGIDKKFDLPEVETKGYLLSLKQKKGDNIKVEVSTVNQEKLYLTLESRGEVVFSKVLTPNKKEVFVKFGGKEDARTGEMMIKKNNHQINIPIGNLEIGTARLTLFNKQKEPLAERLIFLNADKKLNISVKTDKEKYLPRESVAATLSVKDENGKGVKGNFAMAVSDENMLTFANDKQANILSSILLNSELRGEIEAPNFYFETSKIDDKINRFVALDLLMMTQGWKRYSWGNIKNNSPINIKKERKIIAGKVINKGESVANVIVKIEDTGFKTITDNLGRFQFENVDLYEAKKLTYEHPTKKIKRTIGINQYDDNLELRFYPSKGRIIDDATGEVIPFANVIVKDTKIGMTTDLDGYFDLQKLLNQAFENGIENPTLIIQYIGYENKIIPFDLIQNSQKEIIQITIARNTILLESVVIASSSTISKRKQKRAERKAKESQKLTESERQQPQNKPKEKPKKGKVTADKFNIITKKENDKHSIQTEEKQSLKVFYYQPKSFKGVAKAKKKDKNRTDFRSTIYWNGNVQTDENGTAKVTFRNADAITTYRITVAGFGQNGTIGNGKSALISSMPFSMRVRMPNNLIAGDLVNIPITLVNNSDEKIKGKLKFEIPAVLKLVNKIEAEQTIPANEAITIFAKCKATGRSDVESLKFSFKSADFEDEFEQNFSIERKGFPMNLTLSGTENLTEKFTIEVEKPVENSAQIQLKLFPTVLNEVMGNMDKMLRQPSGCFEQTSSSNYPNILALQYLKQMKLSNPKIEEKANGFLKTGYKRLTSYEVKGGGFEWFGNEPAHEGLTAYGLMQFVDMSEVYPVSELLINRTANWLLSRRNGKGNWKTSDKYLHSWGGTDAIFGAYISWALVEAGYSSKLKKELNVVYKNAVKSEDVYVMALAANALLIDKDKRGKELLEDILKRQNENGSWKGLKHSIVHSTGNNLTIETTSLVMLAMMKAKTFGKQLTRANDWLMQQKSYHGYGNTQSTILALKAMVEFAKNASKMRGSGEVTILLNDKFIGNYKYSDDEKDDIIINTSVNNLPKGKQNISVYFEKTKYPLPYEVEVTYATDLPPTDKLATISIQTELNKTQVKQGELVRLTATIQNETNMSKYTPLAIIGIPSGTSPQIWQLKKMQKEGLFDYYELFNGYIAIYYTNFKSNEKHVLNFDLKAEVPGVYETPASSAFLYYGEDRFWSKPNRLEIN